MNFAVEAWRGVASLMVLWAHWGPPLGWPMGPMAFAFTGVDLFFVLSGFVFAPTVMAGRVPALGPYAVRRFARIYPAYLVALAVYVLLAWQAGKPLRYLPEHLLMAHMQSREMTFYYNPVFWSLPAEVTFYGLVPVLAWWLGRRTTLRWTVVFAVALALRLGMVPLADGTAQNLAYLGLHHLPGLLLEFLMGVWVWQRNRHPLQATQAWALGVMALLGWLALAMLFQQLTAWSEIFDWRHGQLGLAAAACFALALRSSLCVPAPKAGGKGAWFGKAVQWGGRLSYALYLLHIAWLAPAQWLVQAWGVAAGSLTALAALGLSCWALHTLVEEPARTWGRALAERLSTKKRRCRPAETGGRANRAGRADP